MFSMTVRRASALVNWNVRTMPSLATLCADESDIRWPLKCEIPSSGVSNPVSRLKNVVFPAPFGPISAVIRLRSTSR